MKTTKKASENRLRLVLMVVMINSVLVPNLLDGSDYQNFNSKFTIVQRESSTRTPTYIYFIHGYGATNSQFSDMIAYLGNQYGRNYVNKRPLFFDYFSKYQNEKYSFDDVHNIEGGISTYASDFFKQLVNTHPQGAKIDIIAHSMGGLILREMLRNHRNLLENNEIIIRKAITLGTPHLGTKLATHLIKEIAVNFIGQEWQTQVIKSVSPTSSFILQLNHEPGEYMNGIRWLFLAGESTDFINALGQVVIYNGVACDGFVDINSALGLGLDIKEVQRVVLQKNHYQLIFDPLNKMSYRYINEWLQIR